MDKLVVLEGGSRHGESTTVAEEVQRLYAASEAPGLLDVYSSSHRLRHLRGNEEPAVVFEFSGQEPAEGIAPELIHMPSHR